MNPCHSCTIPLSGSPSLVFLNRIWYRSFLFFSARARGRIFFGQPERVRWATQPCTMRVSRTRACCRCSREQLNLSTWFSPCFWRSLFLLFSVCNGHGRRILSQLFFFGSMLLAWKIQRTDISSGAFAVCRKKTRIPS